MHGGTWIPVFALAAAATAHAGSPAFSTFQPELFEESHALSNAFADADGDGDLDLAVSFTSETNRDQR